MEKKKIKIGLVPKLIIAIIVGILFGQFLPEGFCRFVVTLSGFFSTFLKFVIPLMILAYVTMGIADLSQGAGKLLLITVALAYGSTLIAGSASYLVSSSLFPHFMSEGALDQIAATADASLTPFFSITLEPVMDTLSAVALAFVMGLCLSSMRGKEMGNSLYNGMSDFSKIIDKVLHVPVSFSFTSIENKRLYCSLYSLDIICKFCQLHFTSCFIMPCSHDRNSQSIDSRIYINSNAIDYIIRATIDNNTLYIGQCFQFFYCDIVRINLTINS